MTILDHVAAFTGRMRSAQVIRAEASRFDHVLHTAKQGLTVPYAPVFIHHEHDDLRTGEEGEEPITGRMKLVPIGYR
jgi:hypothetical protein